MQQAVKSKSLNKMNSYLSDLLLNSVADVYDQKPFKLMFDYLFK